MICRLSSAITAIESVPSNRTFCFDHVAQFYCQAFISGMNSLGRDAASQPASKQNPPTFSNLITPPPTLLRLLIHLLLITSPLIHRPSFTHPSPPHSLLAHPSIAQALLIHFLLIITSPPIHRPSFTHPSPPHNYEPTHQ